MERPPGSTGFETFYVAIEIKRILKFHYSQMIIFYKLSKAFPFFFLLFHLTEFQRLFIKKKEHL